MQGKYSHSPQRPKVLTASLPLPKCTSNYPVVHSVILTPKCKLTPGWESRHVAQPAASQTDAPTGACVQWDVIGRGAANCAARFGLFESRDVRWQLWCPEWVSEVIQESHFHDDCKENTKSKVPHSVCAREKKKKKKRGSQCTIAAILSNWLMSTLRFGRGPLLHFLFVLHSLSLPLVLSDTTVLLYICWMQLLAASDTTQAHSRTLLEA